MKRILYWMLLMAPCLATAQEKGMHFEETLTWKEVLAKAKKENKYIFVDCFTTWCGPCKAMAANIFPDEAVGAFMNERFINVSMQIDKTKKDNDNVKRRYNDAAMLAREYHVRAYPTILYFSPDGQPVHKSTGAPVNPAAFIVSAQQALDSNRQFYTLLRKLHKTNNDPALVKTLALVADSTSDKALADSLANIYLASQKNLLTKDNLEFIHTIVNSTKDAWFPFLMQHTAQTDSLLGKGKATHKINRIAIDEYLIPIIDDSPNWDSLRTPLAARFPGYEEELVRRFRLEYYFHKEKWDSLVQEMGAYMPEYAAHLEPYMLSNFALNIYLNSMDPRHMEAAIGWVEHFREEGKKNIGLDYINACLLYKLGQAEKAISLMEDIYNTTKGDYFMNMLSKWKRGEKTWEAPM